MKKLVNIILIVLVMLFLVQVVPASAQCAMCKATIESNAKTGGNNVGAGLNAGILYLMSIPYILVGLIAYFWYKSSKKETGRQTYIDQVLNRIKAKYSQS